MHKALLLGIDGVLIQRSRYFSEKFAEEYEVDIDKITPFFTGPYQRCVIGQADLREELKPYLKKWEWGGNVEDFLEYWFTSEAEADEDMLKLVDKLREFGVDCHLASDQEEYRAAFLLEDKRFADYFDESFFSCDLRVKKENKEFFKKAIDIIGIDPKNILYFDDDPENVESALAVGIDAHVFTDVDSFKAKIKPLISN